VSCFSHPKLVGIEVHFASTDGPISRFLFLVICKKASLQFGRVSTENDHVRQVLRTAFYFIPSAMTGFIVSVFPFRNRVSSKEAFEGLELGEGKPSRPVLRGPGGRKAAWLLGGNLRRLSAISRRDEMRFAQQRYFVN
jgi:hypothetical protein